MKTKTKVFTASVIAAALLFCSCSDGGGTVTETTPTEQQTQSEQTSAAPNETEKEAEKDKDMDKKAITTEDIIIKTGEKEIFGALSRPAADGKYPAVILSHGYNGSGKDFTTECKFFAENGFAAYSFDFCGGSGGSRSSGKTTDMTLFTEKDDLTAVYEYFAEQEYVDERKIYLLGGSQGGMVTALASASLSSEKIAGIILYFPALNIPDDWRKTFPDVDKIPEVYDFWGMKLGREFFASMHTFDPYSEIRKFDGHVIIIYGDEDAIVPYDYMVKAQKTYPNAELVILPNEGHGFSPKGGKHAMKLALDFMTRN